MSDVKATTDFNEFAEEWTPRIRGVAASQGFRNADLDDATQSILTDLLAGDYLNKYDSKRGPFTTFIYGHIRIRLAGMRRAFWQRGQREVLTDVPNAQDLDKPDEVTEELFGVSEVNQVLAAMHRKLLKMPATQTKDLARLFAQMIEQVAKDGQVSHTEIARSHGYSRQAISQQISDLMSTSQMAELHESLSA